MIRVTIGGGFENVPERDAIVYYAEPLPGDRAQLIRELWIGGERVECEAWGSPAPMDVVREVQRVIPLR